MAEGRGLHILNIFKGTQCHHLFAQMPLPPGMGHSEKNAIYELGSWSSPAMELDPVGTLISDFQDRKSTRLNSSH